LYTFKSKSLAISLPSGSGWSTVSQDKLIHVNEEYQLQIYDLTKEKIMNQWKLTPQSLPENIFILSKNQNCLVIVFEKEIEFWNLQTQQRDEFRIKLEVSRVLETDENHLLCLQHNRSMEKWNINQKKCILRQDSKQYILLRKITSEYFVAYSENFFGCFRGIGYL